MYTNTGCTIYNRYTDKDTRLETYKRTYLQNVFWNSIAGISKIKNGIENSDQAKIIIPFSVTSDSAYLKPKEFKTLTIKEGYFTFSANDKIAKGEIPENVSMKELENLYDDVLNITSVDTLDYGSSEMRHWEVLAK